MKCRCANTGLMLGERRRTSISQAWVADLPTNHREATRTTSSDGACPTESSYLPHHSCGSGSNVRHIREVLGEEGRSIKIISKVENQEGSVNFDDILEESDGRSWSRAATSAWRFRRKRSSSRAETHDREVQRRGETRSDGRRGCCESMVKNPRPPERKPQDVANAVLDGTDCVMLSGETAAGASPRRRRSRHVEDLPRVLRCPSDHYQLFKSILAQVPHPDGRPQAISRFLSRAHRTEGSCRPNRGPDSWRIHRAAVWRSTDPQFQC